MEDLKTDYTISTDFEHNVLLYTVAGFWNEASMKDFLVELGRAAKPFIKAGEPFGALGDLSHFVPQTRETAAAIRDSLMLAKKNGMDRVALVTESALVQMQYKRIGEGLDMAFFTAKTDALTWIRRPR